MGRTNRIGSCDCRAVAVVVVVVAAAAGAAVVIVAFALKSVAWNARRAAGAPRGRMSSGLALDLATPLRVARVLH